MNFKNLLIGGGVTTLVIWIYTNIVLGYISSFATSIDSLLMGLPFAMGFFIYLVADYLNKQANKMF